MKKRAHEPLGAVLVSALVLCLPCLSVQAQDDISISASEFQRMVYAGHLLTQLDEKPELDASLQVLLEIHRRNPQADPSTLAGVLLEALDGYRVNAPTRFLHDPWRDEILSAYLEAFHAVPAHTTFNPATMSLLHSMRYRPKTPDGLAQSQRLHAGNQRLLTTEDKLEERDKLVELCTSLAVRNARFYETLDLLLWPETGVLLGHTPAEILSINSALGNSPTMQELIERSNASGNGSITISTNVLNSLFTSEMQAMHEIINRNRVLHLEISASHSDLSGYLDNPALVAANRQREAEVKQGQQESISAAYAAATSVATLTEYKSPRLASDMRTVASSVKYASDGLRLWSEADKIMKAAACGNLVAAGLNIFSLFIDQGPSPEEMILEEIGVLRDMIQELRTEMHTRFDQVDVKLNTILQTLSDNFDEIDIMLGNLDREADTIRKGLLDIQTDLHRLERDLYDYLQTALDEPLVEALNFYLAYEEDYGTRLSYDGPSYDYIYPENKFHILAFVHAKNHARSPEPTEEELQDNAVYGMMTTRRLEARLNYINQFISGSSHFSVPPPSATTLANPRDWFVGAQAYLQLAHENPDHFRLHVGAVEKLDGLIANGNDLKDFFGNLTFTDGELNSTLNELLGYYSSKLNTFMVELENEEQLYAGQIGFPSLETWRQWDADSPRLAVLSTEVLASHVNAPSIPRDGVQAAELLWPGVIALGEGHGIALEADGTVIGWGENNSGALSIPADATNITALSAGKEHNLALRSDGTMTAWGHNSYGEGSVPAVATNIAAIAAGGYYHNLALKQDGTVIAWGYNGYGQTNVPVGLSNVVDITAGYYDSAALKADGTVVTWGDNRYDQTSVPMGLTNIVAIAGRGFHTLALKSNGTVVAWGINNEGQTNVPPVLSNVVTIAAGTHHSLALKQDGTVTAWGLNANGQTNVPPGLSNVVAIAADKRHSLALQADGTMVVWGWNDWFWRPKWPVPAGLTNVVAVDAGLNHCLALKSDGTVVAWGDNTYSQTNVPPGLSDIVAIAAGDAHNVVLRADGTAEAWGVGEIGNYGQDDVPDGLNNIVAITASSEYSSALLDDGSVVSWGRTLSGIPKPNDLTNAVAISASRYFSVALRADGTVSAWGDNYFGACNVPPDATNIVAISTGGNNGLGLRADGTVVAWGRYVPGLFDVPAGLSNVVSIAAGNSQALAMQADGTAVTWGYNGQGQCNVPTQATNVLGMAGGYQFSLYLQGNDPASDGALPFVRGTTPILIRDRLIAINSHVHASLSSVSELNAYGTQLSGADALVEAVIALALPHALEKDDVLHSYLYGSEALVELDLAQSLVAAEVDRLERAPHTAPKLLQRIAPDRALCFQDRLGQHLNEVALTGQPEIPRMVGQTLRLLYLLRDSWVTAPPSVLEIGGQTSELGLVLYGEPYAIYTLQESPSLTNWFDTSITELRSVDTPLGTNSVVVPTTNAKNFYRAVQP